MARLPTISRSESTHSDSLQSLGRSESLRSLTRSESTGDFVSVQGLCELIAVERDVAETNLSIARMEVLRHILEQASLCPDEPPATTTPSVPTSPPEPAKRCQPCSKRQIPAEVAVPEAKRQKTMLVEMREAYPVCL